MKKLITLAMGLVLVASIQAVVIPKTIYVTADAVGTTLTGTSWASPVTLKAAIEGANSVDSIFVKGGTYAIDPISNTVGTSYATTMIYITSSKIIVGGFAGTETNSAQRPKSDLDANGVICPWEFTNLTILDGQGKYMVLNFAGGSNYVDGIVAQNGYASLYHYNLATSATATTNTYVTKDALGNKVLNGTSSMATAAGIKISTTGTYKNIIIRNNTITTKDYEGPYGTGNNTSNTVGEGTGLPAIVNNPACATGLTLTSTSAVVTSLLVEGNIFDFVVSDLFKANTWVNAQTTAPTFSNTTGAGVYNIGTLRNSIIRNNITKGYNYTTTSSGKTAETALRGGGVYINSTTSNLYNCIIANNEIQAYNISSLDNVAGGGLFADNGGNVYNCTFVNNKVSSLNTTTSALINVGYGGGALFKTASSGAVKVLSYNNVFWNNSAGGVLDANRANLALRNNLSGTMLLDVQNNLVQTAPYWYGNSTGVTTQTGSNTAANFLNCKIDLNASNTDVTTGPNFVSPAAVVGYSDTASDVKANWSIGTSSYLLAKGSAAISGYTMTTDFSGVAFDVSTPSVGAYQTQALTTENNTIVSQSEKSILSITKTLITTTKMVLSIKVYNLTGALVAQATKTNQISIAQLPTGVYFVAVNNEVVKFEK